MSNRVFVDASFWIVLREETEDNHIAARELIAELFRQRSQLVTTLPVVCEIHAYFTRKQFKRELVLNELCRNPIVTVEDVLHQDRDAALRLLATHRDKSYSLCDALSFIVMRRLGVKRALAFDEHFRQFGEFEILS